MILHRTWCFPSSPLLMQPTPMEMHQTSCSNNEQYCILFTALRFFTVLLSTFHSINHLPSGYMLVCKSLTNGFFSSCRTYIGNSALLYNLSPLLTIFGFCPPCNLILLWRSSSTLRIQIHSLLEPSFNSLSKRDLLLYWKSMIGNPPDLKKMIFP